MDFRKKIILFSFTFFLIYLLLILFPLKKSFKNLSQREQEILNLTNEKFLVSKIFNEIKEIQGEREKIAKIQGALFDPKNPVGFIEFIEGLAKSENLEFSIKTQEREERVLFSVSFSGPLENALNLLMRLEKAPYFLRIEGFRFSKSQEKITGTIDFEILKVGG